MVVVVVEGVDNELIAFLQRPRIVEALTATDGTNLIIST